MKQIVSIATLVNEKAIDDLKLLLFSLELWNESAPNVYIFCDSVSEVLIRKIQYKGKIVTKPVLNQYTGLSRVQMERLPGTHYENLFADFTAEKTFLMEWAIAESKDGVLFCDADICHVAKLPELPENTKLALSPHFIRTYDAERYGYYNAGFLYIEENSIAEHWRKLCKTSSFFEQKCLEELIHVVEKSEFYEFPIQVNYGWWRLWQGTQTPEILQKEWSFLRKGETDSGIYVQGIPLQSIHTHFGEKKDRATFEYNEFILKKLKLLSSMKKTKQLCQYIEKNFK